MYTLYAEVFFFKTELRFERATSYYTQFSSKQIFGIGTTDVTKISFTFLSGKIEIMVPNWPKNSIYQGEVYFRTKRYRELTCN